VGEEDRRLGAEVEGETLYGEGSQEGEDAGLEASGSRELWGLAARALGLSLLFRPRRFRRERERLFPGPSAGPEGGVPIC
jgi:hypothetical protein